MDVCASNKIKFNLANVKVGASGDDNSTFTL